MLDMMIYGDTRTALVLLGVGVDGVYLIRCGISLDRMPLRAYLKHHDIRSLPPTTICTCEEQPQPWPCQLMRDIRSAKLGAPDPSFQALRILPPHRRPRRVKPSRLAAAHPSPSRSALTPSSLICQPLYSSLHVFSLRVSATWPSGSRCDPTKIHSFPGAPRSLGDRSTCLRSNQEKALPR
jgi:hypothetical protein